MPIKVENIATIKPPTDLEKLVNQVFDTVPKEHTLGITKVVIVNEINNPRLAELTKQDLPILYHPRTPQNAAFIELALKHFTLPDQNLFKRLMARANFRPQIVGALLASIGQHYYFTYSHGIKKHQATKYESQVRAYVEKHFVEWRDRNAGRRARLFKPLQPYVQRLDKWLKHKMLDTQKASKK
jgi:hypothetical protein